MPYSEPSLKHWSLEFYMSQKPETVVDVGAGAGTYAKLFRHHHNAHWTAVEMWGPYVERFGLDTLYNRVIVSDSRWVSDRVFIADMVIFGDVLEHMTQAEARELVGCCKCYSSSIIASIPVGDWPQGSVDGVPTECHVSTWSLDDVKALLPGADIRVENRVAVAHWVNK